MFRQFKKKSYGGGYNTQIPPPCNYFTGTVGTIIYPELPIMTQLNKTIYNYQ